MLHAAGRKAEADEALNAQIAHWGDSRPFLSARPMPIAAITICALEWLERAYKQNDVGLADISRGASL